MLRSRGGSGSLQSSLQCGLWLALALALADWLAGAGWRRLAGAGWRRLALAGVGWLALAGAGAGWRWLALAGASWLALAGWRWLAGLGSWGRFGSVAPECGLGGFPVYSVDFPCQNRWSDHAFWSDFLQFPYLQY